LSLLTSNWTPIGHESFVTISSSLTAASGALLAISLVLATLFSRHLTDWREKGKKRETAGGIVIGTVKGDIHDIGENMVAILLAIDGFTVHDLGIDVQAEQFIEALKKNKAITQGFADDIGADGYDPTAVGAVKLARRLTGK